MTKKSFESLESSLESSDCVSRTGFTSLFVCSALQQSCSDLSRPNLSFSNIISDSRKVTSGSLFVALSGEKFDGHDFINAAIAQGATGILCKKSSLNSIQKKQGICIFAVEDPLESYRQIAAAWRKEFSIPVIAIAGSAGKTTTKELLGAILLGKWKNVLKTQGSQNGFVGIPMTLLELRQEHEAAVIEIGIDEIGAMQKHISLVKPDIAVLTAIGPEHLESLKDVPTVAQEEGIALSSVAKSGGTVAINLDDPWIKPLFVNLKEGRKVSYTLIDTAVSDQARATNSDGILGFLSADGKKLEFGGLGLKTTQIEPPLPGTHNARNLLGAITIAAALGLSAEEIKKGLTYFKGAEGRSEIRKLPGSTHVVCDYYNAQPMSMEAALDLLHQFSAKTQRSNWACLADMLELGPEEERFHRELATPILGLQIQNVLLFGPRMTALEDELRKRGYTGYLAHFSDLSALTAFLTEKMQPGDTVLIKGSRGMKMEGVWKLLESYIQSHWSIEEY